MAAGGSASGRVALGGAYRTRARGAGGLADGVGQRLLGRRLLCDASARSSTAAAGPPPSRAGRSAARRARRTGRSSAARRRWRAGPGRPWSRRRRTSGSRRPVGRTRSANTTYRAHEGGRDRYTDAQLPRRTRGIGFVRSSAAPMPVRVVHFIPLASGLGSAPIWTAPHRHLARTAAARRKRHAGPGAGTGTAVAAASLAPPQVPISLSRSELFDELRP